MILPLHIPLILLRTAGALTVALCLAGCEIAAGIPDRTLAPDGDDACPPGGAFPDSPTALCVADAMLVDCTAASPVGQDGSYLDPSPGYSYKLGLSMSAKYSVLDRVTGLVWEETASTVLQWNAAEAHCATLGPGWRLPSRLELLTILDYGLTDPATDPHFKFSSGAAAFCGSKSLTPYGDRVWGFEFAQGKGSLADRITDKMVVRCVLGQEAPGCLAPSGDGLSVRDGRTGLTWLRHPPEELFSWAVAIEYCEGLDDAGFDDWRLPSVKELQSLADDARIKPTIDPEVFPETSGIFWSSSPSAASPGDAWSVDFDEGGTVTETAAIQRKVRCTR